MPATWTLRLALAFAVIAVVNTALQAWLWTYPMAPDPTGRDPHGRSTAPRFWTNVHRFLGYVFLGIYVTIMWEMLPRLWEYLVDWDARMIAHAAMGLLVGPVLVAKLLIVRRFQRFGHRLPWFGGTICALTLALVVLVVPHAWRLQAPGVRGAGPLFDEGRRVVTTKCIQCHATGTILEERRDAEDWDDVVEDMQENAEETPGKQLITSADRAAVVAYLSAIYGEADRDRPRGRDRVRDDDEPGDTEDAPDDERGRRGRGRGRGRGGR